MRRGEEKRRGGEWSSSSSSRLRVTAQVEGNPNPTGRPASENQTFVSDLVHATMQVLYLHLSLISSLRPQIAAHLMPHVVPRVLSSRLLHSSSSLLFTSSSVVPNHLLSSLVRLLCSALPVFSSSPVSSTP